MYRTRNANHSELYGLLTLRRNNYFVHLSSREIESPSGPFCFDFAVVTNRCSIYTRIVRYSIIEKPQIYRRLYNDTAESVMRWFFSELPRKESDYLKVKLGVKGSNRLNLANISFSLNYLVKKKSIKTYAFLRYIRSQSGHIA